MPFHEEIKGVDYEARIYHLTGGKIDVSVMFFNEDCRKWCADMLMELYNVRDDVYKVQIFNVGSQMKIIEFK